jgi:hypothetical protein
MFTPTVTSLRFAVRIYFESMKDVKNVPMFLFVEVCFIFLIYFFLVRKFSFNHRCELWFQCFFFYHLCLGDIIFFTNIRFSLKSMLLSKKNNENDFVVAGLVENEEFSVLGEKQWWSESLENILIKCRGEERF